MYRKICAAWLLLAAQAVAADMTVVVDSAVTVPVNLHALTDDTDFKSRETAVAYNAAGMDLVWNFVTTAGVVTQTAVTPTDGTGVYDWSHVGDGIYKIEIPASGGGSINNDSEGYGWFSGLATGVLPWRGPVIQFSPANVANSMVNGTDRLQVDALELSSDSGAADNAEAFFDGTGYAGTNNVIPTVTTLTGHTAQTGDAFAIVNSGTHGNAALKTLIDTIDDFVDSEVGAIKTVTDQLTAAQAEPSQGAPAANATPLQKLGYLYKAWRNKKTQTGSLLSIFADDGTTVDHKATVGNSSGTTTVEEVVTGP